MKRASKLFRANQRCAKRVWGKISSSLTTSLRILTSYYGLSVQAGDLILLDGRWYVTHGGLLRLASRRRCLGIHVEVLSDFCDPPSARWVCRATVFAGDDSKGFVGFGDADPSNTAALVRGAELRVAETRAVNRALRKAYGIGICSVEEIGSLAGSAGPECPPRRLPPKSANGKDAGNGSPRVRDRLCQLIRQHRLDPVLVKAYAVDFCGVSALREANREQVENFVSHLADWVAKDKNALLCQLNSYMSHKEGAA
jgi:hypothetical protein